MWRYDKPKFGHHWLPGISEEGRMGRARWNFRMLKLLRECCVDAMRDVAKSAECTAQRLTPDANHELWVVRTCQGEVHQRCHSGRVLILGDVYTCARMVAFFALPVSAVTLIGNYWWEDFTKENLSLSVPMVLLLTNIAVRSLRAIEGEGTCQESLATLDESLKPM